MVHERSIAVSIIATIFTLGIYGIFWFVGMAGDIRTLREKTDPRGGRDFLLSLVTCGIYMLFCMYQYPKYIVEIQEKKGLTVNDISMISVLLAALSGSIISMALIQNELNKIAKGASA